MTQDAGDVDLLERGDSGVFVAEDGSVALKARAAAEPGFSGEPRDGGAPEGVAQLPGGPAIATEHMFDGVWAGITQNCADLELRLARRYCGFCVHGGRHGVFPRAEVHEQGDWKHFGSQPRVMGLDWLLVQHAMVGRRPRGSGVGIRTERRGSSFQPAQSERAPNGLVQYSCMLRGI